MFYSFVATADESVKHYFVLALGPSMHWPANRATNQPIVRTHDADAQSKPAMTWLSWGDPHGSEIPGSSKTIQNTSNRSLKYDPDKSQT